MDSDRIKAIQKETAYPDSVSVQQALLKVWNECEQENKQDKIQIPEYGVKELDEIVKRFNNGEMSLYELIGSVWNKSYCLAATLTMNAVNIK